MSGPLTHAELRERLAAYALEVLDDPEQTAVALHLVSCADCREEATRYRQAVKGLSNAKERTWERMADALAARREELDELLSQLARRAGAGPGGAGPSAGRRRLRHPGPAALPAGGRAPALLGGRHRR